MEDNNEFSELVFSVLEVENNKKRFREYCNLKLQHLQEFHEIELRQLKEIRDNEIRNATFRNVMQRAIIMFEKTMLISGNVKLSTPLRLLEAEERMHLCPAFKSMYDEGMITIDKSSTYSGEYISFKFDITPILAKRCIAEFLFANDKFFYEHGLLNIILSYSGNTFATSSLM